MYRAGSSPPSPVLDFAPSRFMATARVSWASRDSEPRLIAPVEKRLTISVAGSTSSSGIARSAKRSFIRPRNAALRVDSSLA